MKPVPLSFQSIEIRRMPGFVRGGFRVDDLCRGVNVVYGPNASGKTTLGSAIRRLLRPRDRSNDHDSLWAQLELGNAQFSLDYDAGRVDYRPQNNEAPAECPTLAPAEIGNCNLLALQDLIRSEEDHDLAGEIVKELAGGYDVAKARNGLGFADRKPRRGSKAAKEHQVAERQYREALNRQEELLNQQKTLGSLKDEKADSQDAQTELVWLEKASKYLEAKEHLEAADAALDRFPSQVAEITAHDVAELDRLAKSLAEARRRQRSEQNECEQARQDQEESALPAEGLPSSLIVSLQLKRQRLTALSGDVRHQEESARRAAAELDEARRSVGPHLDPDQARLLDAGAVEDLFQFAGRFGKFQAENHAAEELTNWLATSDPPTDGESSQSPTGGVDALREAIILLERWLGADRAETVRANYQTRPLLIAAGVLAAVSVVMMFTAAGGSWVLGLALAAAMIGWAVWPRTYQDDNRQAEFRRDYESLDIDGPASWSDATVRPQIRHLQRLRDEAALAQEKAARFGNLKDRLAQLKEQRQALKSKNQQWIERLGVDVHTYLSQSSLALLAANLERFQKARYRLAGALAAGKKSAGDRDALLAEINQAISPFSLRPAADADQAAAQIEELDRRGQAYELAQKTILHAEKVLADIQRQIEDETGRRAALFDRVGLPEDEQRLRGLAQIRPEYDQAQRQHRNADAVFHAAKAALADRAELTELSAETILQRREACRRSAARLETIGEEIGAIEEAVAAAKRSTDLEAILARREQSADRQRREREGDYDAVVGHLLADYVTRQHREAEQPGILQRARELFARITHGRYELQVQEGAEAEFRALETLRREVLGLDELSSGTRLQLLLAVRVAFVERQEQGVKVPLILDETLGNSDERRAEQIIDAVIEICRQGRQIFYFTAQHDEVGKWRKFRQEYADVEYHEVDLAEVRRFSHTERVPAIQFEPPQPPRVPSPDGLDWAAYGRRLAVPPLDPNGETGEIHLWYLIDDIPTLHRLLKNGVNKWGQLQTLVSYGQLGSYGQLDAIDANSPTYRRAEASARVLEEASNAWRVGRGVPVDRAVLADSEAVSPNFIDRVTELAAENSGDGQKLLAALEAGQAKGFRTASRHALGEYLATEGYLDQRPRLNENEIRERVRAVMFSALEKELLRPQRFEQLVRMIGSDGQATQPTA